jgi:hypothetical protein
MRMRSRIAAVCVALLAVSGLGAAEQQKRTIRVYNASPAEQEIKADGEARVLLPGTNADLEIDERDLGGLALPPGVIAVERRPLDGLDSEELHILHVAPLATCAPTIAVRVPLLSCRFGTAEAQVEPVAGASYRWAVEGGSIVSGDGTASVLIGFGAASSALASVTVTHEGCALTGAAILNLRNPLTATVAVDDANVGPPTRVSWAYNTSEPILTQLLQLPDQPAPVRLAPDVRSYLFTPSTEGTKTVKLTAALYRIGARRRAVRSGSGPQASSCSYVEAQDDFRVRARCTQPTAVVSGGGSACDAETIRARLQGTPPFTGRWSRDRDRADDHGERQLLHRRIRRRGVQRKYVRRGARHDRAADASHGVLGFTRRDLRLQLHDHPLLVRECHILPLHRCSSRQPDQ